MMHFLDNDIEGSISYGHLRKFMVLLPPEQLKDDPQSLWFEASIVVVVAPLVVIPTRSVLKSTLAGGMSCALSTSLMHPLDTMKTCVKASTLSFLELMSKLPQIGYRGLYRGSILAIVRQFSSHGLCTGFFRGKQNVVNKCANTSRNLGMGQYVEAKKVARRLVNRELEPWETLVVGALSGGLAAVVTIPSEVHIVCSIIDRTYGACASN